MSQPSKPLLVLSVLLVLLAGCVSNTIAPLGQDTYMVSRGGWPNMNGFAVEAWCYKAANEYCAARGLVMIPVETTTIDGAVFAHNASSKLVFRAVAITNAPAVKP